jgi:hypothetical protein
MFRKLFDRFGRKREKNGCSDEFSDRQFGRERGENGCSERWPHSEGLVETKYRGVKTLHIRINNVFRVIKLRLELVETERDPEMVRTVIDTLLTKELKIIFDNAEERYKELIIKIIRDNAISDDWKLRYGAVKLISHLELHQLLPELVKLAVDKELKVNMEASEAIEKYGKIFLERADEKTQQKVINLARSIVKVSIHDRDRFVRDGAVKIIEAFKLDLLPELAVLCFDDSTIVNDDANKVWEKRRLGITPQEWFRNATEEQKKRVIEIVKANIKSDDDDLKVNAINCIREFEIKSLLIDLEMLLASEDLIVSKKAEEALVKLMGLEEKRDKEGKEVKS